MFRISFLQCLLQTVWFRDNSSLFHLEIMMRRLIMRGFCKPDKNDINIVAEAKAKIRAWFFLSNIWRAIDYSLAVLAFATSITVIFYETSDLPYKSIIILLFSSLTAVLTIISFAIEPKKHMRSYRRAYGIAYSALMIFECSQHNEKTILDLSKSVIIGEQIIHNSYDVESIDFNEFSDLDNY